MTISLRGAPARRARGTMLPRGLRRGGAISTHSLARAVENLVVKEESPVMLEREESLETDNMEIPDKAVITSVRHENNGHGKTVENSTSAKTDHNDVSTYRWHNSTNFQHNLLGIIHWCHSGNTCIVGDLPTIWK